MGHDSSSQIPPTLLHVPIAKVTLSPPNVHLPPAGQARQPGRFPVPTRGSMEYVPGLQISQAAGMGLPGPPLVSTERTEPIAQMEALAASGTYTRGDCMSRPESTSIPVTCKYGCVCRTVRERTLSTVV
eukprot:2521525-Rhodomonas_salina.3